MVTTCVNKITESPSLEGEPLNLSIHHATHQQSKLSKEVTAASLPIGARQQSWKIANASDTLRFLAADAAIQAN